MWSVGVVGARVHDRGSVHKTICLCVCHFDFCYHAFAQASGVRFERKAFQATFGLNDKTEGMKAFIETVGRA